MSFHACVLVRMYAWIHVEGLKNKMWMQKYVIYLDNDLVLHGMLKRMHNYMILLHGKYLNDEFQKMWKWSSIYVCINTNTHFLCIIHHKTIDMHNYICTRIIATQHNICRNIYIYVKNNMMFDMLGCPWTCAWGMHKHLIVAHVLLQFILLLLLACVQLSSYVSTVYLAIPRPL